ncbi:transcriptional regulator [Clostridium sardiniense]|uniref:Transcriptional regulator n=1 Tax=Clostridium sardiniense TaxID=29369 RepID=A0ABS7KUZ6_CLOSR|nr:transcriptional regulator [Clostridium sardiniense]MBY0754549.1 transcriptional regulator [Clostridium sardiniense]MDQ0460855.1 hypothetical protein [Clostridium sardiniense]
MDKETFKKTEAALYRYFQYKKKIYYLKQWVEQLKSRLEKIEKDIIDANVTIDYYQNGIGISERVQTSPSGNSFAEEQMCKEITKLEREHLIISKKIFKNNHKIRELERYVDNMETNLNTLEEEDRRYIELKYGDKKSVLQIARSLNIAQATAYRKRGEVIAIIAEYKNTIMFRKKAENDKHLINI